MKKEKEPRYKLVIYFHNGGNLSEEFTYKKTAESYKSIIDGTVHSAVLIDRVNNNVQTWK